MSARVSGHLDTGLLVRLYVLDCPNCGIAFAITTDMEKRRRKDGGSFYCPNGHSMSWPKGKSDEEKLDEALVRERALQDQLSAAIRDGERVRSALIRDRHRFANGVCPCCNRSFENVRRHMVSKHPEYDVAQVKQSATVKFKCSCGRSFDTPHGLHIHQGRQRSPGWDEPSTSRYWAHLTEVKS